jgi:uncharacterized lipoprotein YajG
MREQSFRHILFLVLPALLLIGCASLEKRVDLGYERKTSITGGAGELLIAKPVTEHHVVRAPGGRTVLGTVNEAGTQITTTDDVSEWIMRALMQELYGAGFEIKTVGRMPEHAGKGVLVRIVRLSGNQSTDGITITTRTDIELAADLWKNGRLLKTITVATGSEDKGLDRSGAFVSDALQRTLQAAMQQLLPEIVRSLEA